MSGGAVPLERIGLIGNCQYSALVDATGAVVWCCLPRFDAPPTFGALLDPDGGSFRIGGPNGELGVQRYIENTNVLETAFTTPEGRFRVVDFAPRFVQFDRTFRPTQLVRIVEPIEGAPRVRASCDPRLGWTKATPARLSGSHHVSFDGFEVELRLTTDMPLSYLDGRPFALTGPHHFILSWGSPVEEPIEPLCHRFLRETVRHWQRWVKHCDVPTLYQSQVIRSALALKLHCFEDTGGIVAAMTTSLPESPGSGRTWDYRYCWLRDSYYALIAFQLLGQFEEREQFLNFLLNVVGSAPDLDLAPLYRVDGRTDLDEVLLPDWAGYDGNRPVRVGNEAARHRQNDVYGEMVMALTPLFLDERFRHDQTDAAFDLLTRLARKAVQVAGVADAGIWEYRSDWRPQTFSSVMSWAGADRMARVAARRASPLAAEFEGHAVRIRQEILRRGWNPSLESFVASYDGDDLDASLLQAVTLRLLPADDPRLASTIRAVQGGLSHGGWLRRYATNDGFGVPSVAFVICSFWLIEALAAIGRADEARALMDRACAALSPLGLLAEDLDPGTGRMWGNFPQAYSHVGLIHAAFAASPRWSDIA